ncbi:MAG TPA: aminoglycoside 6-adenylyltransferase [Ktedonobacterales bacterium]
MTSEAPVLERLTQWATRHDQVRALVLESSRAVAQAPIDALSDYDVLLIVLELRPFIEDDAWLSAFGTPLITLSDPLEEWGAESYIRMALYEDHTKVDYILAPVTVAHQIAERQELPGFLDWGYRALLDKDGLTTGWPAPTRTAYIPTRPSEREYRALIEQFWWESTYVAKNLWRDELLFAKYNLDIVMRHDLLVRLLEWRAEVDRGWSWKPGVAGRGLKQALPRDTWAELEATWRGAAIAATWEGLYALAALFRRVAREVGAALGYSYPDALDQRISAYLHDVQRMPH